MQLSFVDSLGFHFRNNGRLVKQSTFLHTHLLANTLVQIKPLNNYYGIFLMEPNNIITNNSAWKEYNKFRYLANECRTTFGSYDQRPSSVNLKPLKVFMLKTVVAEQLLTTNLLYLSEREFKDVSAIVKYSYLKYFKYELPSKDIVLPTTTVPKQTRSKATERTEDNLVKVGSQLIQRPMRKVS